MNPHILTVAAWPFPLRALLGVAIVGLAYLLLRLRPGPPHAPAVEQGARALAALIVATALAATALALVAWIVP